jgi:hypothetical protein
MLSCSKLEHDDMTAEKTSPRHSEKDERKPPRDSRNEQVQATPPFLNEGPEQVRDSHC